MILLAVVFIFVFLLAIYYIGWNIKKWLSSMGLFKYEKTFWLLMYVLPFSSFLSKLHESLEVFYFIGNGWMFFFQYGLMLCIVANISHKLFKIKAKHLGNIIVPFLILYAIYGIYNAYNGTVRTRVIESEKLEEELNVVVASDFHIGIMTTEKHIQEFVEKTNQQKPDLVLLVGDIVDDKPNKYIEKGYDKILKNIESTYGVYAVLGNHEYYGGELERFEKAMNQSNITLLKDETIKINDKIYLTGREDLTNNSRKELVEMEVTEDNFWIVMDHTPSDLETPSTLGVDLHLSGHTHNGQLFPNQIITGLLFEVDYGYAKKDGMNVLVSSGYGFWGPPMRTNSQSELWSLKIK